MWYWIGAIVVLLILLEEGLYFLFNRLAFKKTKKQVNDNPKEESTSTKRRRFRRQKH